jgi:hypothetical protein
LIWFSRYVAVLRMLLDVFAIPLRQAAELPPDKVRPGLLSSAAVEFTKAGIPKVAITRAQARVIFHELDSLAAINQLLLEQLEERCSKANWSSSATVGDIFLSIMSFLKGCDSHPSPLHSHPHSHYSHSYCIRDSHSSSFNPAFFPQTSKQPSLFICCALRFTDPGTNQSV